MSTSTILAISEVAETQANKHLTINEGFAALEQSINARLDINMSAGDYTLLESEFTRNFLFVASGQTSARSLFVPPHIQTVNTTTRFIAVKNGGSFDLAVLVSGASPGAQVSVPPGVTFFCHVKGQDVNVLGSIGGGISYNVSLFVPTLQPANSEILRYDFPDAVAFNDNFTGSKGSCRVNPTSSASYDIRRNGTSIGSATVSTSGVFTFITGGTTTETFNPGDILTIISPVTQDVTLQDVNITLRGLRA